MYISRTLNEHEIHYSTVEKECLAVVWATKVFRPYLYGQKFTIITDHRPLQWLFNLKEPNSKLIRWRLRLEEFDYQIIYKKGTSNTNADFLSRIEANPIEINSEEDLLSLFNNPGDVAEREDMDLEEIERLLGREILKTQENQPEDPKIQIL